MRERKPLPADTGIARVKLRVADLERARSFYGELMGVPEGLIELVEIKGARPRPRRSAGLYHTAILLPTRRDLAALFVRLVQAGVRIHGASDHGVSEAIYFADPDGNGIEIYADRPKELWQHRFGQIHMVTEPLDLDSLLGELEAADSGPAASDAADSDPAATGSAQSARASSNGVAAAESEWALPASTIIGHVHLQVSDLHTSERFYHELLGFDVMTRAYPGALFLAAGGYHHHFGLNTWAGVGIPPAPEDAAGLESITLQIPDREALLAAVERLRAAGFEVREPHPNQWEVEDPQRIRVVLATAA